MYRGQGGGSVAENGFKAFHKTKMSSQNTKINLLLFASKIQINS